MPPSAAGALTGAPLGPRGRDLPSALELQKRAEVALTKKKKMAKKMKRMGGNGG